MTRENLLTTMSGTEAARLWPFEKWSRTKNANALKAGNCKDQRNPNKGMEPTESAR